MADVLAPPIASTSSTSPSSSSTPQPHNTQLPLPVRPRPRERIPSYAQNRMSTYSQNSRSSRSRPTSTVAFPAFQSSLAYTSVRDFAWPVFHPLHYGAPEATSGATTPGSEWTGGRRLSDPMDLSNSSSGGGVGNNWTAGPWGGDGVMYGDQDQASETQHDPLPSTSFGGDDSFDSTSDDGSRKKHRKSKSYANITDYERGRRRESAGYRRSRASGDATASDMFRFGGQSDPAGRDTLRQSRGYAGVGPPTQQQLENGRIRADSHFQSGLLPNRSYPNNNGGDAGAANDLGSVDPDNDMPLDSELSTEVHSPQRQSIGPEDEELYAGRSLALYAFEPENSNELRLREGQVIMGWLVAEDPSTGEQGLVPEEYVRLLSELPHFDESTGMFLDGEEAGEDEEGESEMFSELETSEIDGSKLAEQDSTGLEPGNASVKMAEGAAEAGIGVEEDSEKEDPRVDEAYERAASQ
ncbi:HOG (high osmolarity glycerol) pathway protein [Recurvomyces mirabilis]|uniref:HOG (High osmolarity glycerol) pathway protein n=1 Tax=Recurvomyces mirabilis TaxID=574656 RepID=A0AAE0WRP4_9PEZI|nr:HOG (high osmolarity glycerol) pathway protein [Recurvomyces mirabilis]